MSDTVKNADWLAQARNAMADYAALRRHIEQLEALSAQMLAEVIGAYAWPENVPVPDRRDTYGPTLIGRHRYAEDLIGELAVAHGSSETAAAHLVTDVTSLADHLPGC